MAISPRPGMGSIAAAITGNKFAQTGLQIPAIEIDPRHHFVRGAYLYAGKIDRLGMSFTSFKEPLQQSLNTVIIPSIHKNFAAQGRPRWAPLKKRTIESRLRQGYSRGPILQRTGRLKREATRKNIWEIKPLSGRSGAGADILSLRTIYFDQKVPYAQFHQLGATTSRLGRGLRSEVVQANEGFSGTSIFETGSGPGFSSSGKMPARPFMQLTTGEEVQIYNIFVAFMVVKVNTFWGEGSVGL